MDKKDKKLKVGDSNINYQGLNMTIIEFNSPNDFYVKFENGYIKHCTAGGNFRRGLIKNTMVPTVYNVGYIGEIKGAVSKNYSYKIWYHMIGRCYNKKDKHYCNYGGNGVIVCEEWKNYSNFKDWFDLNVYTINDDILCIDKDILIKGNKIYSPETCILIPSRLNKIVENAKKIRGEYKLGVSYHKKIQKYIASSNNNYIGCYKTENEAFVAYKTYKEQYIKKIADEYKDKIPQKLYEALYNWKIEEDD